MEKKKVGSVEYHEAGADYFAKRQLRKHARVWSLWALGVGAVISGHFSGWNFGLGAGGFSSLFFAAIIIGIMRLPVLAWRKCRRLCRIPARLLFARSAIDHGAALPPENISTSDSSSCSSSARISAAFSERRRRYSRSGGLPCTSSSSA
jgi:hypothetical protein